MWQGIFRGIHPVNGVSTQEFSAHFLWLTTIFPAHFPHHNDFLRALKAIIATEL